MPEGVGTVLSWSLFIQYRTSTNSLFLSRYLCQICLGFLLIFVVFSLILNLIFPHLSIVWYFIIWNCWFCWSLIGNYIRFIFYDLLSSKMSVYLIFIYRSCKNIINYYELLGFDSNIFWYLLLLSVSLPI